MSLFTESHGLLKHPWAKGGGVYVRFDCQFIYSDGRDTHTLGSNPCFSAADSPAGGVMPTVTPTTPNIA